MNAPSLVETKLQPPRRRRGIVRRSRLLERLASAEASAVVLLSAPAGFGKTTLLIDWLSDVVAAGVPAAWVSLDRGDNDPALYWSYLVAAVGKVVPGAGGEAMRILHAAPTDLEDVVGSLVNDLADVSDDLVLVLDDYHVIESVEVHESMRFLVEHLPAPLSLVVAGRTDPPWPLAGLRAGGHLLEMRVPDLRFTSVETTAFLNDISGLELRSDDIAALEARTEGWVAALQLAAISLRDRDDPSAFIQEFSGDDRFVVDYLADEVLERQPDHLRSFLIETSILSRFTAARCAAVTEQHDAKSVLEALERSNLFLVALDDRRLWYRYHHLFRDVLRARLAEEPSERITALHRRAAERLEAEGDRIEAVAHAMAAGLYSKAAELVELTIPSLRQARRDATLRRLLDALPEEVFARRPVLNIGRVGARMAMGDTAGVDALLDNIADSLAPDGSTGEPVVHDHDEYRRLPAQVEMYRAGLGLLRGDLAAAAAHGQRTAELSPPDDHVSRGAAQALVGLARWTGGDLESAATRYSAAITEFESARHHADILGCSLALADIQGGLGHLHEAERTLKAGLDLVADHGPLRGTADMQIGLAEVHIERNELDAAAERLRAGLEVGESLALPQFAYRWRVVDARIRSIGGDHERALQLLHEAERLYNTDYSPAVEPVPATAARTSLAAGDLDAAERWVVAAGVGPDDDPTYLRQYEHLTLARVLLARGAAPDAGLLLERLLAAAQAGGRLAAAIEAGILLALAHRASGNRAEALVALEQAVSRAAPERFIRRFVDAGPPLIELLDAASWSGPVARHAGVLRAAVGVGRPATAQQRLVDELSRRELDVLRLLRTDLSGPEIAAELVVSLNTVRTHTRNIYTKLGVTNRRAAVRRADELGL